MATTLESQREPLETANDTGGMPAVVAIAAAITLLHLLTNGRYGFHRDELQFLSDARHMDWGFVAYPPFTPAVERLSMSLFGLSLEGLRLFSVLAQGLAIVVTGLMARALGGGRLAQAAAALAVALSILPLLEGTEFQYTTFDYLWWVLIAYFTIRLLRDENPRWWLAIGATIGLGFETKYAIGFFVAGILGGIVLTRARRYLLTGWFWAAIALTLAIVLPNLLWQAHHGWISLDFLKSIHARDVSEGRAEGFLWQQCYLCVNLFAAPLWIGGLVAYARNGRYRLLAWMYWIPLALFYFAKGRGYYLAPAYPMLLAMGAAAGERWLRRLPRLWQRILPVTYFVGVAAIGALSCAIVLPLATSGPLMRFALQRNGDLREEIGWDDLLQELAAIRDSLPADQQAHLGIVVGNYGEQGAVEILGPAYHLPAPISGTNSAWLRGYPTPTPTTLIVVGLSQRYVDRTFTGCRLAGKNQNHLGIQNEESTAHRDIFVCGSPKRPWAELWKDALDFG